MKMTFNTHNRTPRIKNNPKLKALLLFECCFIGAFFIFSAIVTSIEAKSILPALIVLLPFLLLSAWMAISIIDMEKSHIVIDGDRIRVVDYWFCIKKEKTVSIHEIKEAKIASGKSGLGSSVVRYIVFRNEQNRYLFKLIYYPENKEYFEKLLNLEITS